MNRIVIAGAGLAGVTLAQRLRHGGYEGDVTLLSGEAHLPYDRPPLSKEVLTGARAADAIAFHEETFYADQEIELVRASPATRLDVGNQTVTVASGREIGYDGLVIATGLRARRPALPGAVENVLVLRTLDDSTELEKRLTDSNKVLILGGGFIGCEVASSVSKLGKHVTLVESSDAGLLPSMGALVGHFVTQLHVEQGVDVRLGVSVRHFLGNGVCTGAELSDGSMIETDLVVLGIGSIPNTEWLDDADLQVGDGVVCDAWGRTSASNVWAMGDVARWAGRDGGGVARVEHWTNAREQAVVVAKQILGLEFADQASPAKYMWSDQYGMRIQVIGTIARDATSHQVFQDGHKFMVAFESEGRLTAVVASGMATALMRLRGKLESRMDLGDIVASARQ